MALSVPAIQMWNSLPAELKLDPDWGHLKLETETISGEESVMKS